MNDAPDGPDTAPSLAAARPAIVRPRDAASLILLRGEGRDLEILAGRRPLHLRFMPGVYVFPGGAIDREDRAPWSVEAGAEAFPARLAGSARAALRETWEETGVLVGRRLADAPSVAAAASLSPVERAYAEEGVTAALDTLTYVGRAITPSRIFRRFNTRFFLCDGARVFGEPAANDEFEDVRWHPIGRRLLEPVRDVTRFMLKRAIALRSGTASADTPLFCTVGSTRRIRICREALAGR